MIIILSICIIFSLFLSAFVLAPLLTSGSKNELSVSLEGFSDAEDLRKVTHLRDALFQKLIYGKCLEEEVDKYSQEDALKAVVSICSRLQQANLPWQPKAIKAPTNLFKQVISSEKGSSSCQFLMYCFILILGFFILLNNNLNAQAINNSVPNDKVTAPSDVVIPPPTIISSSGYWIPSVNQFILIPMQGKLHVYYVGMFSNTLQAKGAKVQIPLPKDFQDLKISGNEKIVVEKSTYNGSPVLNVPLSEGLNQLSAEFSLSAFNGIAGWKPNDLNALPGFSIFIMPEYEGALRNLFLVFGNIINIWPPRIVNIPLDFKSFVGADPFESSSITKEQDKQLTRQLIRIGNNTSPYPAFEIKGIVPQRTPLYVLTLFFACFLFGLTVFFIIKTSK